MRSPPHCAASVRAAFPVSMPEGNSLRGPLSKSAVRLLRPPLVVRPLPVAASGRMDQERGRRSLRNRQHSSGLARDVDRHRVELQVSRRRGRVICGPWQTANGMPWGLTTL